jgi:hypothetical protein
MTDLAAGRVSPFGHPGITAHVQLPQAYRSLSRPSSPLDAKASTVCLIAFDLKFVRNQPARASFKLRDPYANNGPPNSVLIPHTRLSIRLAANPQTTTIHPSVVKEQIGPRRARQDESDAS